MLRTNGRLHECKDVKPGVGGSKARSELDLDSEFIADFWFFISVRRHEFAVTEIQVIINAYQIPYQIILSSLPCFQSHCILNSIVIAVSIRLSGVRWVYFISVHGTVWCRMGLLSFTSPLISYLYIWLSGVAWAYYSSTSIISYLNMCMCGVGWMYCSSPSIISYLYICLSGVGCMYCPVPPLSFHTYTNACLV